MKIYAYIIAGLALIAALSAGAWFCYNAGRRVERLAVAEATMNYQLRENELIAQLADKEIQTKVVYRDRIKVVQAAQGACIDERIPAPLLDSLHNDLPAR